MKKIATLAALAAVLLAGCASQSSSDTVGSVNDSFNSQDYVAPAQTAEDRYLSDVHAANNMYLEDETDSDLLDIGYQTCDVLRSGYTVQELVQGLLSDNPSDAQIEYESIIIGNAIEYFCPEYLNQINA